MVNSKLTEQDLKDIQEKLKNGVDAKTLAEEYRVHRSTIYNRAKFGLKAKKIPLETKKEVIRLIKKDRYTKAEAAEICGLNIGTVTFFTRGMALGHPHQGNHIIRSAGIKLLNRLITDGCIASGFLVSNARRLQHHFPMIKSARYKEKTFYYLEGREEGAIKVFFRDQPIKIIRYTTVSEISELLGCPIENPRKRKIVNKFREQHDEYWKNRMCEQRSLEDYL